MNDMQAEGAARWLGRIIPALTVLAGAAGGFWLWNGLDYNGHEDVCAFAPAGGWAPFQSYDGACWLTLEGWVLLLFPGFLAPLPLWGLLGAARIWLRRRGARAGGPGLGRMALVIGLACLGPAIASLMAAPAPAPGVLVSAWAFLALPPLAVLMLWRLARRGAQ